jgi:hypothetical protein
MRRATVHKYKGRYIISGLSRTTDGVYIGESPLVIPEGGVTSQQLGSVLVDALGTCREGVPHPTDWTPVMKSFLVAAGAKSWSEFGRSSTSILVQEDGGRFTVIPSRRDESGKGGVLDVPENAIQIRGGSLDGLGEAVQKALAESG